MKCSAIVCTHNPRRDFLDRVLAGLRAQTLPLADWELLVIDNGSRTPVAQQADLSWHPLARHVREEELGLTPARLRGIREAQAETLVFVDDDTVLAANYLEQALAIGQQFSFIGAWGGSVTPEYEKPLPAWVGDQVWRLTVVQVTENIWSNLREGFATIPVGAGLCCRRSVGRAFAERCARPAGHKVMDRTGTALTGYGDVDLAHGALDLGLGTGRFVALKLTHLIPAGRLTLDYFVRHAEGDAASLMLFRVSRGLPITAPVPHNWLHQIRWFLHRLIHRVPREQYEIQKAHHRGLLKGFALVQPNAAAQKKSL